MEQDEVPYKSQDSFINEGCSPVIRAQPKSFFLLKSQSERTSIHPGPRPYSDAAHGIRR